MKLIVWWLWTVLMDRPKKWSGHPVPWIPWIYLGYLGSGVGLGAWTPKLTRSPKGTRPRPIGSQGWWRTAENELLLGADCFFLGGGHVHAIFTKRSVLWGILVFFSCFFLWMFYENRVSRGLALTVAIGIALKVGPPPGSVVVSRQDLLMTESAPKLENLSYVSSIISNLTWFNNPDDHVCSNCASQT